MAVIVVCILLVLAGLAAVVGWGGLAFEPPPEDPSQEAGGPPPARLVVRRYLWYLAVAMAAGVGAGVLAAGAGGRLVMRLLAVTAGDDAQGRITEAGQVVGRITTGGTIGFMVFTGLLFGLVSGAAYLLVRRWLPAGRVGGLVFGGLLLVVAGTRLEPLRPGNVDFDLVGPGWVSVVAFAALVLFHGVLVAALAGRVSRALPLLDAGPRAVAGHAPLLLLVPLVLVALVLLVVGLVAVLASRLPPVAAAWRDHRMLVAGRAVLAVAVLAALPGFAAAVADILGRP
jgi:hypothetical protein